MSTYDFSTLCTTLPHILIKEKLLDLIEGTFYKKESKLYLACNDKKAFFTSADHYRGYHLWSCQNVCDALSFLLDNIYIRFGTKLYRQRSGTEAVRTQIQPSKLKREINKITNSQNTKRKYGQPSESTLSFHNLGWAIARYIKMWLRFSYA